MLPDAEVFEKVQKYVRHLTKCWSEENYEDVLQECLLHVWRNKDKWANIEHPMGMVRSIVRSAFMDSKRKGISTTEPIHIPRTAWKEWIKQHIDSAGGMRPHNISLDSYSPKAWNLRDTMPAPEHWAIESIELAHMWGKLERVLSPSELIVLKYILAGLNHREIGKLMDVTESRISQIFKAMEAKAIKLGQGGKVPRDTVHHPKKHKYSTLHWKTRKKLEREAEARRLKVLEDNKAALVEPIPAVVEVPMLVAIEIWWMPTKRRET